MKKNYLRAIAVLLLLLSAFMTCGTACAQEKKPEEPKKQEESEADTDETTLLSENKPSFSSIPSGSGLSCYIRLDGIEGESKDAAHSKWIEVTAFSHGVSQETQTGTPEFIASASYPQIVFTHKVDSATPKLQRCCMNGMWISAGEFHAAEVVSGRQTVVYMVSFNKLRVESAVVKTVTSEDGTSYLVEEVTMLAEKETVSDEANPVGSARNAGSGLSYFVKLDGIEGGCEDSHHAKWIAADTFSHGAASENQAGNPAAYGIGTFEPVVFVHGVDQATSRIRQSCLNGAWIASGEFQAMKSIAGKDSLVYSVKMEEIRIVKAVVKTVTDENGNISLVEEVTLLVNKETWTSVKTGLDDSKSGSTEAEFDQSKRA